MLDAWPGSAGKGALFPMLSARRAARQLRRRFRRRDVLLLGRRVAAAFDVKANYFEWVQVGSARVAVVPHPSGVNRFYNDPDNVARMRAFMDDIRKGWQR